MKTLRKVSVSLLMLAVMAASAVLPTARAFAGPTAGNISIKDYVVTKAVTTTEKVSLNVKDTGDNYEIFIGNTGDLELSKSKADNYLPSKNTMAIGSAGFTPLDNPSKCISVGDKKACTYSAKSVLKGDLASYSGSIEILQWKERKLAYEGITTAAVNKVGIDSAATKKVTTYMNAAGQTLGYTVNIDSPYLRLNLDSGISLPIDLGSNVYCMCMLPLDIYKAASDTSLTGFNDIVAPEKTGHKTGSWNVAANAGNGDVKNGSSVKLNVSIDKSKRISVTMTVGSKTLLKSVPAKDAFIKLSPNYVPNTYTVKFNFGDGTSKTTTVQYKQKYSAGGWVDKNPTKTGYIFAGWYTDPKDGTVVTKDTMCLADLKDGSTINLYPHYNTDKYTMTITYKGKSYTKKYDYETVISAAEMLKAAGITSSDKYEIKINNGSGPATVMKNVSINGKSKYTVRRNCSVSIAPVYSVTFYGNKTSKAARPYAEGTDLKDLTPSSLKLGSISNKYLTGMKKEFAGWVDSKGSAVKTVNSKQSVYALYNIEGSSEVTVTGTISSGRVTEAKINGAKTTIKSCNVNNGKVTLVIEYSGNIAGYDMKPVITIDNIDVGETKTGFNTSVAVMIKGTVDANGNAKISSAAGSRTAGVGSGFYYSEASKLTVVYHGNGAYYGVMRDQDLYKNGNTASLNGNNYSYPGKVFRGWATSAIDAKNGIVKYKNRSTINPKDISGDTLHLYAVWG